MVNYNEVINNFLAGISKLCVRKIFNEYLSYFLIVLTKKKVFTIMIEKFKQELTFFLNYSC